jgi:hypothetical protein
MFALISNSFSQGFYDISTINTIEIQFTQSNWDYLLDQLVANGLEERLMGSVTINGVLYDSVGVRYKGNSSYSPNRVKNPLNIKLDYIISDQEIEGYGTIKLSNVFKDPSFVREILGYEIARKYFPASQANYANVYINGTLIGLYTSVQDVDKLFMRTHFGGDEYVRAKGELGENLPPGQMGGVWEYFGSDSTDYSDLYVMESDFGWRELVNFLDTINNHNAYADQVLNIDRHLWFLAFSNLLVNLDGPINNPQNFYLFKDNAARFNPIPWDLNECFGVFTMLQNGGIQSITQLQHLDPFVNLTSSEYPIINKILSNATYRKMYVSHFKTLLAEVIANGWYETRALELQDIIDAAVQADPNKFYTYTNFINNINTSVGGGPNAIVGITQLMEERVNYLTGLSEFQAQAPEILNIAVSPETVTPGTEIWFTVGVSNASQVFLDYRAGNTSVFTKTPMFDDGTHNDGAAGDGVYGVSLVAGNADLKYYVYAENATAATFSPAHAENEFYTLSVVTDGIAINEFMADNETTVTDQDGEYEDWIEFYNNSQEAINLGGYFLTDDAAEPDQWTFPDTTIAAGGFLVVWADEDEEQEGLHASFKISKSGESIILSNPQLDVVDEITFELQQTDITFGRFPNGTGSYIFMTPTCGAINASGITYLQDEVLVDQPALEAFPNPFNGDLTLVFTLNNRANVCLAMMNFLGQSKSIMDSQEFDQGTHRIKIETTGLSKGLWVCRLMTEGSQNSQMMVKVVKY